MKAVVQDNYGSGDSLELRDVDKPRVGDREVLIRVRAAGVNPADWAIMSGLPYVARPIYGLRKPKNAVRGTDVAGEVEAVGSAVTQFHVGDGVFGWCDGSFAEYAAAAEDALAHKPASLTFEQAASVPMAGLVALQALRKGNVGAGTKVLNNVGGFWGHRHLTADGLEHTFALNHLAPFLLTSLLLERLKASAPARVVTVSSGAQAMGKIDFDDLMGEHRYSGSRAYDQSKLANVMFTYELARRLEGTGVSATALHPGLTRTGFGAEDAVTAMRPLIAALRPFMGSPERGADTAVYLASSPEAEGVSGRYFAKRKAKETNKASYDRAITARLWRISSELVGLPHAWIGPRPKGSRPCQWPCQGVRLPSVSLVKT